MRKMSHKPLSWNMGALSLACAAAAVAVIINGCGSAAGSGSSENSQGGISTGQTGFAARLSIAGRFTTPADTYNELKSTRSAGINQLGYSFDDAGHTLVFNVKPLRSMFLRANGKILGFTDANGLVKFKTLPPGTTTIDVVNNITEAAVLTFPASQLGTLDNPANITLTQQADLVKAVAAMDDMGLAAARSREEDEGPCGGDCGHANKCCLDYDGGVPVATEKQCNPASAAYHFLGSTCGKWYWEGVCREGMEIKGDEGVCLSRHKGRWCQQIDDSDFSATVDKPKILVGETATITIHNNTRKNEIKADLLQNIGNIETTTAVGPSSGQSVVVAHYDGTGPFTWHPDRTLTYRAPSSLPNGQEKADVTVRVYGQTGATDITIEVCH